MIIFPTLERELALIAKEVSADYVKELTSRGYDIAKSVSYQVVNNYGVYEVQLNLYHYWRYIEYGRRKGAKMPPIAPIAAWIKKKGVLPRGDKPIKPEAFAFVVARGIAKNGIKAKYILDNTLKNVSIDKRIENAIQQDVITYFQNI